MNPIENSGGEAGGVDDGDKADSPPPRLLLKRSELAILRRMSDRYPIVEGERREIVDITMDIVRNAKSKRLKLSALNVMVALDRTNLDEIKTYIAAGNKSDLQPKQDINVNVTTNVQIATVQTVLDEYGDIIADERAANAPDGVPGKAASINGAQ